MGFLSSRKLGIEALAVVSLLSLVACGGSSSSSSTVISKVVVSPSVASLQVGAQQTYKASATNSSGIAVTTATFDWTSSDPTIATVDATGVVVAKSGGTAKITATDQKYNVSSDPATLNVMPQIGAVTISPVSASIKIGEHQQFVATAADVKGNVVSNAVFQWNISYSGVASIDASGLTTGISTGTVFVTASTGGVSSPVATLNVTN